MGHMQAKVEAALAAHVPAGEQIQLCDYGTVQGEAGVGQKVHEALLTMRSSTAAYKAHDYVAIAVTNRSIIVVPIKLATGLLGMKLKPVKDRPVEVLARDSVILEVGGVRDIGYGRRAATVKLVRRDGSARVVELYDNPGDWAAWQR